MSEHDVTYASWQGLTGDATPAITAHRVLADSPEKVRYAAAKAVLPAMYAEMKAAGYDVRSVSRYETITTTNLPKTITHRTCSVVDIGDPDRCPMSRHREQISAIVGPLTQRLRDAVPDAEAEVERTAAEEAKAAKAAEKAAAAESRRAATRRRRGYCQNSYCDGGRVVALTEITDQTGAVGHVCSECASMPMTCEINTAG